MHRALLFVIACHSLFFRFSFMLVCTVRAELLFVVAFQGVP